MVHVLPALHLSLHLTLRRIEIYFDMYRNCTSILPQTRDGFRVLATASPPSPENLFQLVPNTHSETCAYHASTVLLLLAM